VRQNTQNRLIALHGRHREVEAKMTAAAEVMSSLREQKMQIRASIQNTCVPLAIYDEMHGKVTKKTKRADNELYERQRALAFDAFGLPCGPAPELDFEKVPEAARPALHWETLGYQQAIDGQFADPKRDGVPPENLQDYMRGAESGTKRNAAGIKALKEEPAKAPAAAAPPLMVGEDSAKAAAKQATKDAAATVKYAEAAIAKGEQPAWNGFPDDHTTWSDSQREVFRTWAAALDPSAEIDLTHLGAIACFDELYPPSEEEAVGGGPDDLTYNFGTDDCASCGMGPGFQHQEDCPVRIAASRGKTLVPNAIAPGVHEIREDFVEATEEELAAQAGRPGGRSDAAAGFDD
jgi:hypothetical protein